MRPPLHPDMGQIVLCARVARQLVGWRWRKYTGSLATPSLSARFILRILPPDGFGMLRFAVHSLAVYLDTGMPSADWLENVLEAAHFGSSFRRCFFFDYKENRRPYPRVTNRGVQSPLSPTVSRLGRGKRNA